MKPVRRKFKRHFGHSAKRVAIRSQRPWYFQWIISGLLMILGFSFGYWYFNGGASAGMHEKIKQMTIENQALQTKLVGVTQDLKIQQAAQDSLAKDISIAQDENLKLKKDLIFYKNIAGKK